MNATDKIDANRIFHGSTGRERFNEALTLIVLLSSGPLMGLMFTAIAPVLPGIAAHFGTSGDGAFIAQMVMTMPGVGVVIGGPTLGWLADRMGSRALLFGSLIVYFASGLCGLFLENVGILLATRFLLGLSAAGVGTSTMELISEQFSGDQRARVLGYQGAAGAFVGLTSLLAAGAIGQAYGWRAPFVLYVLGAVILLVALAAIPRSPRSASAGSTSNNAGSLWPLWPYYGLIVLCFVAVFMNAVQVSFLLAADGTTSPQTQSWVLAANALANTTGAWSYGALRVRFGPRATFCLSLGMMAVGYAVIGLSHDAVSTAIGSAIAGFGAGSTAPHVFGLLLERAPEELRGRAIGFLYTATYLGDFLNPWVVAPLRAAFGIHGAFIAMAVVIAAAACYIGLQRVIAKPATS